MTVAADPHYPLKWGTALVLIGLHVAALLVFIPGNFSWTGLGLMLVLHWITGGLGITLGWHRLVAHRSFQVPKWLEYLLVFCGTLAFQGGPTWWIGLHRHHHLHSDQDIDHHTSGRGFWWSHMGWMLYKVPAEAEVERFTKDIIDDPVYRFFNDYFLVIQIMFAGLLYWIGGWNFVIWGVFARLIFVYHCTWLVNSATHKFGYRTYDSGDRSTNCWWVALLTYGEGWHNNHHAFQYSARHGLRWWEIDPTWGMVQVLKWLGLARNIKLAEPKSS
jgi:stearoyl-CoA desaturase (delta-9 desaturase)